MVAKKIHKCHSFNIALTSLIFLPISQIHILYDIIFWGRRLKQLSIGFIIIFTYILTTNKITYDIIIHHSFAVICNSFTFLFRARIVYYLQSIFNSLFNLNYFIYATHIASLSSWYFYSVISLMHYFFILLFKSSLFVLNLI